MMDRELLKRFKDGEVVFHCPTQGIWDRLISELNANGYNTRSAEGRCETCEEDYCIDNESGELGWYDLDYYKRYRPYLEVVIPSLEDFKESSEIASVTIMEHNSNPIRIAKMYTRAKVTKGPDGYTVEILPTPKFSIGDLFIISSGKLGKVISTSEYINGKYTYEIQWTNGKKNKCQPEDSMIKLEASFE